MRRRRNESGLSLLEVTIAAAILGLLIGAAVYSLLLGTKTTDTGVKRGVAEDNVLRALGIMVPEIRQSGTTTSGSGIAVSNNAAGAANKKLSFKVNRGFTGGSVDWASAPTITYEWLPSSGRSTNVIRRTDSSTGVTGTIAAGIDPSFRFDLIGGDAVRITISSTVALNDGGTVGFAVTETALIRN